MSKRRPQKPDTKSEFALWLKEHADLVVAAGLPPLIMSTEDHWNYFLDHNGLYRFDDDPSEFSIQKLTPLQRAAFTKLLLTYPKIMDSEVGRLLIHYLVQDIEEAYRFPKSA